MENLNEKPIDPISIDHLRDKDWGGKRKITLTTRENVILTLILMFILFISGIIATLG